MKKIILTVALLFAGCFAFADTWAEFEQKVLAAYPWLDYVAYSVYEKWEGNTEAFLTYLYENPIDLDAEEIPNAI